MAPVPELIDSPGGRPVAEYELMVAVDDVSVADVEIAWMAVPDRLLWEPGLVTVTVLVTVQVKLVEALSASESVAVTVTE